MDFEIVRIQELRQEASAIHVDMETLSGHFSRVAHTIESSKQTSELARSKIACLREK